MSFKRLLSVSLVAGIFTISGCSGDINISEGDQVVAPAPTTPAPTTPAPTTPPPTAATCPSFATELAAIGSFADVCEITGTFTANQQLTSDILWVLSGRVAVGNDNADPAVLTVAAGTTIIGRTGEDFLVVRRGSKIEAVGTANAPITMTSFQDVAGQATGIGQWGGLVLLGNAPSNLCDGNGDDVADASELANCGISAEGNAGLYGGNNPNDNSGTLKYVVVKQAGNALSSGDELNGISFAGVGDGTVVDFIQIHENLDDGVEFFGGTVNVKHLVLTGNGDDAFDWSFGWTGKAQFVYTQANDTVGNRGIEADNGEAHPGATPLTNPTISNFTIVGGNIPAADSEGVLLRHGTAGSLHNVVITGPAGMGECLEVDSFPETRANAANGLLLMTHSVVACNNGENFKGSATASLTTEQWFLGQAGNSSFTGSTALNLEVDGFTPLTGSPLLGAGLDLSATDSFFEATDYIGAFDGSNNWTAGWTVGVKGGFPANIQNAFQKGLASNVSSEFPQLTDKPVYRLSQDVVFTSDVTFTNDAHWILNGRTAVGNDNANNAILFIQQGTTIIGETGDDFLVARRGSKIEAVGTLLSPIVMTSIQDVTGQATGIGQWGGLVLLGNAPSNLCDGNGDDIADAVELANCGISAEGNAGVYGGNNPNDNSGTLKFVVVKQAGKALGSGDELNGISFAGVGDGTVIDYIQVHENLDDGVEFFGGTVNVKHIVLTGNGDDAFDWSFGWTGKAQFVYTQANDTVGNRGIEADNGEAHPGATPLTNPTISNFTIVGGNVPAADSEGVLLRHGTAGSLHNVVITGPAGMGECLEVDSFPETQVNAEAGLLLMTHSVVACNNGENFKGSATAALTTEQWFLGQTGNSSFAGSAAINLDVDGFTPLSGSPLLGAGLDLSATDSFFEATDYIGAFDGSNNWTAGWTVGVRGSFPTNIQNAWQQGLATDASAEFTQLSDKPVYRLNLDTVFTSDVSFTNDAYWILNGRTAVGNDNADNTTLFIQYGTTVIGETGDDFLVARRGSKIEAVGVVAAPITLTSIQDVTGQATGIGQWGGLVLLGNAPSNLCDGNGDDIVDATELANCGISAEGNAGLYGGNNPNDNSGILKYVIVKQAGKALGSGDELNGISFAGVGDATKVDFIQIHENLDDGVEFFGGTVNVKHLVLTGNGDDAFDWSFGWTGKAQFVITKANDTVGNRGIEADNGELHPAATPLTNPTISNFTIIGGNVPAADSEGVLLRHGTAGSLHNVMITGPAGMGECLEVDSFPETRANAASGLLLMTHSVVACNNGENFKGSATATLTTEQWFLGQTGNSALAGSTALSLGVDGYTPQAGSPLLGTGLDVSATDAFFEATNYIGAFDGTNDWTAGWVTIGL